MDCQSYTYARLDSLDPEVYKKNENDDLKILMKDEKPIPEPTRGFTQNKVIEKIKNKKRVLSTLDIFISIIIVTPCVAGCWRGLWQIMDIYGFYFPAWESFSIGMAIHIILALAQEVFHHVIVEKETKNRVTKMFALFLMKFYLITFNIITIMTWRGGWLLFDRYCQLRYSPRGFPVLEGSSSALWFTLMCLLILLCMKVFKNTLAPPFSIALDSKEEVFLFSTRYICKIIYITIIATQSEPAHAVNNTELAERLVSSQTRQVDQFHPPRPFGVKISGPSPQEFAPISPSPTSPKPLNYPQLSNYRNNYHPKSIQDVIGYMSRNRSYSVEKNFDTEKEKQQSTSQEGIRQNFNSSGGFASNDPFHPYKPVDPSEINLMATASFRFSPPVWKNFHKLYQQPTQHPSQLLKPTAHSNGQQAGDSNVQETVKNFAKPFIVTLNIFPMENEPPVPSRYSRYGQKVLTPRIHGDYPYRSQNEPRAGIGSKGNKMTIHLNVFPEAFLPFLSQDREKYAESTVNKIKFV